MTRELRCIHLWHPGVSAVFLEYSTAQHTKTVSTLRYEVLELLKLLLQIVTRESDQHIWLVATSLTFLKYNNFFYCTLVFVADPHWRPMQFPPGKGGASVTLTASQNCSSTTNPSPVYHEKGTRTKKGGGSLQHYLHPLNLRGRGLISSPLSLTLEPSTHGHHLPSSFSPQIPLNEKETWNFN